MQANSQPLRTTRTGKPRPGCVGMHLVVPIDMREDLRAVSQVYGVKMSLFVEEAIRDFLRKTELENVHEIVRDADPDEL